jgi:hypothetical protein
LPDRDDQKRGRRCRQGTVPTLSILLWARLRTTPKSRYGSHVAASKKSRHSISIQRTVEFLAFRNLAYPLVDDLLAATGTDAAAGGEVI